MGQIKKIIVRAVTNLFRLLGIDIFRFYARAYPKWKYEKAKSSVKRDDGISLVFDIALTYSLSQVGRDFVEKISKIKIPFTLLDITPPFLSSPHIEPKDEKYIRGLESNKIEQVAVLQFAAGDPITSNKAPLFFTPFWEFQSGLFEGRADFFKGTRGAVVFSSFCHDYFSTNAPKNYPILKMTYPLNTRPAVIDSKEMRQRFAIPDDFFAVFFNFDIRSSYDRKNPEGSLEAFAKAFKDNKKVCFVIKVSSADADKTKMERLKAKSVALGIDGRIILITETLSRKEMLSLIACSDIYLSLHRGEGLGLGMLEAMTVGVPVVATNYGGNTDFCHNDTAMLVDYKLVTPKTDFPLFKEVKEWAEPDVNQAAMYLRQIYENPSIGKEKALAAKAFIEDYYSIENFERDVRGFIEVAKKTSKKQ